MRLTHFLFSITLLFLSNQQTHAQLTDSIVGFDNYPTRNVYFAKVDINSGATSTYQRIAPGLSSNYSCCVNYNTNEFYFCDGKIIQTIDAITGRIVSVDTVLTNSTFTMYKYNACDSNIYGRVKYGNTYYFRKYNPFSRTLSNISPLPASANISWGNNAVIDPDSNLIIVDAGNSITGLDINTGAVRYSTPKINLANESFGHIALKCNTHEIIGTSANINAGVKFLSKIDPYTGMVSHISTTGWNQGVLKPAGGGACINQLSGDYFYSGAGGLLIRVNTVSGNIISSNTVSLNEFYYVDHFSTCGCPYPQNTFVNDIINEVNMNVKFENNYLSAKGEEDNYILEVFDINSRVILKKIFFTSIQLDLGSLGLGMYIYKVYNEKKQYKSGKFIKSYQ